MSKGSSRKIKNLKHWLQETTLGREIMTDLFEKAVEKRCRECQNRPLKPKTLVVLRRLGRHPGVEVFAEDGVNVKVIELPDFPDDIPAEELIRSYLPKAWKSLVDIRARNIHSGVFRGISVEEALRFSIELDILRELNRGVQKRT